MRNKHRPNATNFTHSTHATPSESTAVRNHGAPGKNIKFEKDVHPPAKIARFGRDVAARAKRATPRFAVLHEDSSATCWPEATTTKVHTQCSKAAAAAR